MPVLVLMLLAAEPRWGLAFKAPAGCVQPGELAELIERRVGHPVFAANADLSIEGVLRAGGEAPAKWSARLTLVDASGRVLGSRDVTATTASCRGIDEALTLVVALMIDTKLKEAPPPEPPKAAPAPTPPPVIATPPASPVEDFSRMLRRERDGIFLGGYVVEQGVFFDMVNRPDLRQALESRRAAKIGLMTGGVVGIVLGGILLLAEATRAAGSSHWPRDAGFISLGVGVAALVAGFLVPRSPTSDDEDEALIEKWNLQQRTGSPGTGVP